MFDAHEGSVLVDGVDARAVNLASLRRRISVVPQDTSLFDETIEYNLRYGNPTASDAEVATAVDRCGLRPTVDRLPFGLETPVGERGARLSGGERQKISIAR
jgi:ATP-binding cassette subfamily B protein